MGGQLEYSFLVTGRAPFTISVETIKEPYKVCLITGGDEGDECSKLLKLNTQPYPELEKRTVIF